MSIDPETRRALQTCRKELPNTLPELDLVHGFDGYCDRVRTMVESRETPSDYDQMETLATLAQRLNDSVALKNSCSIEWIQESTRAGGHSSHLGRAFSRLGFNSTLIGTYGIPPEPVFEEELSECTLFSVGTPSYTDAVEFTDGKFMLADIGSMASLDWESLCDRVGQEVLAEEIDGAAALSMGYWSTIPSLPSIWDGLCADIWPLLDAPPDLVFVDPADVRRLSKNSLNQGLDALQTLDTRASVIVSANRAETEVLASLGENNATEDIETQAQHAYEALGVSQFVTHTVDRSVVVDESGQSSVRTPHVEDPELTTSAGDHFNAGFLCGRCLGLSGDVALLLGNALANWFVRHGTPPTYEELRTFLDDFDTLFE